MIVVVDGATAHAATGGVEIAPPRRDRGDDGSDERAGRGGGDGLVRGATPVVLIHGAGMDATVWQHQTRYLGHHGHPAVAVDLPGHGRSGGDPLTSIEAMADWTARFVEEAGFAAVHVVGHSMGTFVALELARRHDIVRSLTLCGTSTMMPVHPDLLAAADDDVPAAAALMAAWGHAAPAHVGRNPTPGLWMVGGARALVERSRPGVLATDFRACQGYTGAEQAAAAIVCPATVVIGLDDKMTPPKGARALAAALRSANVVELADTGHSMMIENPRAVKQAILDTVTAAEPLATTEG